MVTEIRKEVPSSATATPGRAWLCAVLAWLIPGAGHLLQGKWVRGLLAGGVVWGMYGLGRVCGGHFFPLGGSSGGTYLDVFWSFMNLGTGLLYLASYLTGSGWVEQPQLITYEYGDTFLKVAGLLNYLVMLDAFDIGVGRKS